MKELEKQYFEDEASFRKWIEVNYNKSPGIWLVFNKKHTGRECISYGDALDTALCFGWIDSLIKKIDESTYARKFTPRTNTSKWSEVNKKRIAELIKNGKMTETGLLKIDSYLKKGEVNWAVSGRENKERQTIECPAYIINALSENEPALANFNALAPTYQRHYILWITSAKREVTLKNRISEAIELLKENRKLGMK
jgi:uncharacterized protein YdeI (YjbR/CyaY-like superfamily)